MSATIEAIPTTRKGISEELAAKAAELETILGKGDDLTAADLDGAKALRDRCKALRAAADKFGESDSFRGDLDELKGYLDQTRRPNLPGAAKALGAEQPGRLDVIGATKAGHALIDTQSRKVLIDNGPGHFGRKAWDAITTPEYGRDFWDGYVRGRSAAAVKDLQLGLDESAGFLAPADFIARIIAREPYPTSLLGRVSRFTTSRDKVTMPRVQYSADDIYTTGFRVTRTGELPASSAAANVSDGNLFGVFKVDVDTWMIRAVVTNDMVEDSAFPLETWLADKFRETIDLLFEDQILNGNNVNAPDGIYNNIGNADKPAVVLSGSAGALSFDGLVDLETELPPQYDHNACFVMHKKGGYRAISKLKDSNGRPLFARGVVDDGLVNARQMTLRGYPVVFSAFAPDAVSATTYPLLFGDLRGQYHVDRVGFTIQVLRELYAETNRLVLLGRLRFGGGTAEGFRMKIQKANNA